MSGALSAERIAELRQQLQDQRRDLISDIRAELMQADEERLHTLAGSVHDRGEEAVSALLVDVDTMIMQQHRVQLLEIEQALARIASGEYGICQECGEGIGYARLKAQPAAARCIVCQRLAESN